MVLGTTQTLLMETFRDKPKINVVLVRMQYNHYVVPRLRQCGCFPKLTNLLEMTICPTDRARLCLGWQRSGNLCSVPEVVLDHYKDLPKVPKVQK